MKDAVIHYTDTTSPEAVDRYVRKWSRDQRRAYRRNGRRRNMAGQKAAGFVLLVITIPAVSLLNGDATIAAVTVPAGLGLILSAWEG